MITGDSIPNWTIYSQDRVTVMSTKLATAGSLTTAASNLTVSSLWLQNAPNGKTLCAKTSINNIPAGAYTFNAHIFAPDIANGLQFSSEAILYIGDEANPQLVGENPSYVLDIAWSNTIYEWNILRSI